MEASVSDDSEASFEVFLHVYDLTKEFNDRTYPIGLGVFHSGVEVDGKEYWFGGHEHAFTGLIELKPGLRAVGTMVLRESILLGRTSMSRAEIAELVDRLTIAYRGNSYHPIHRNCNHFADEFSRQLLKRGIPGFVNRLASIGSFFLHVFKEEWLYWILSKFLPSDASERKNDAEIARASDTPRRSKSTLTNSDRGQQRQRRPNRSVDLDREDSGLLQPQLDGPETLHEVVVVEPEVGAGPVRDQIDAASEFEVFVRATAAADAGRQREVATSFFHLVHFQTGQTNHV